MNEHMNRTIGGFQVSYRDYSLSVLAGQPREINVGGNYWQVISQTVSADLTLEFDDRDKITRRAGSGGPSNYQRVRVTSAVDQTVVISLGYTGNQAPYDRSPVTIGGTINVAASNPNATPTLDDLAIPATSQALIDPVTAARIGLTVQLVSYAGPDFSTYTGYRIGDSSVSATRGTLIQEGCEWDGSAAVYVYNPNPFAITISRQRETI